MGIFTEKSKLKEIIANDKAQEIIEKYMPGALNNPGLKLAKLMNPSIEHALKYRNQIGMSEETAQAFKDEILAIEE